MLQTRRGTEDGFSTKQFFEGKIYEISNNLACSFLSERWAELADVIYYRMLWIKTGVIERRSKSSVTDYYVKKGIVELLEVCA